MRRHVQAEDTERGLYTVQCRCTQHSMHGSGGNPSDIGAARCELDSKLAVHVDFGVQQDCKMPVLQPPALELPCLCPARCCC